MSDLESGIEWGRLKMGVADGTISREGLLRDVKARGLLTDLGPRFNEELVFSTPQFWYYPSDARYSLNPAGLDEEQKFYENGQFKYLLWSKRDRVAVAPNPPPPSPPQTGPIAQGFSAAEVQAANNWISEGYNDQKAGKPRSNRVTPSDGVLPPAGQPDKTPQFFYNRGYDDAAAGRGKISIPPPAPPPAPAGSLLAEVAQPFYDQGYADGQARRPSRAVGTPPDEILKQRFYEWGFSDGYSGQPARRFPPGTQVSPITVVLPPPPAGQTTPPIVPTGSLNPNIGYELYGNIRLLEAIGKPAGQPLNIVRAVGRFIPLLVEYRLLGRRSSDWTKGFGLSGPAGEIIQEARAQFPGQTPQQAGRRAWVGALFYEGGERVVELLDDDEVKRILGPGWAR